MKLEEYQQRFFQDLLSVQNRCTQVNYMFVIIRSRFVSKKLHLISRFTHPTQAIKNWTKRILLLKQDNNKHELNVKKKFYLHFLCLQMFTRKDLVTWFDKQKITRYIQLLTQQNA